jgi:hypothetical protein
MQLAHRQRSHLDPVTAAVGERPVEPPGQAAAAAAPSEQQPDWLATQPPRRERERAGRGRVQPLHVVDRQQDRSRAGQPPDHVEQRHRHGPLVGATLDLLQQERGTQCPPLRHGEVDDGVAGHSLQQVAQRAEREPRLGLGRAGPRDPDRGLARHRDAGAPEGGLADPRRALEQQGGGAVRDRGDEPAQQVQAMPGMGPGGEADGDSSAGQRVC